MPTLVLKFQGKVIREYAFQETGMTIGRSVDNVVVIDNLAVSSHHAKIEQAGSDYVLTDLESTNGTFVNDKKVTSHTLIEGDSIVIGKHNIFFLLPKPAAEAAPLEAASPATMVLDTNRYKELLAKQEGTAATLARAPGPPLKRPPAPPTVPRWLTIVVAGAIVVGIFSLV